MAAVSFFFFNDTATTEIYTLSLHDALPISLLGLVAYPFVVEPLLRLRAQANLWSAAYALYAGLDRKSTRLNSSHLVISYAVFCLKKKKKTSERRRRAVCYGATSCAPARSAD